MNFSQRQADPRRHLVGIAFVILFHAFIVWALVSGLAKKVVDVVRAPIETKVIEEIKKPPPPPEVVVPPPPKMEAPPPPFIPPPEVQIATPPPPAPTITATSPTPPPQAVITPVAPVAPAPPAPPAPAVVSAGSVCPNAITAMGDSAYPKEAARQGLEKGEAVILFTVGPNGEIKNAQIERASHPVFGRAALRVVTGEFKCQGQGRDIQARVPFSYKVE
jgi:protein TonB